MKHAGHIEIPNHSPQQAKLFFTLATQLSYNSETIKKRATKKFKRQCFSELTYLIERLLLKQMEQAGEMI